MSIKLAAPKIGGRTFKTLMSLSIIAVVYGILGRNACFACIGAVFGIGSTIKGGINAGGNRFIGTLVGGIIALPFYWLYNNAIMQNFSLLYLPVGIFLLIYICQVFKIEGGIQPGSVVFFVTLFTVPEAAYVSYVIARIIDTGIGVALSLLICYVWPSPFETLMEQCEEPAAEAVPADDGLPHDIIIFPASAVRYDDSDKELEC